MATWLLFKLTKQSYLNSKGKKLPNASKRVAYSRDLKKRNFKGEWIQPDFKDTGFIERYHREDTLLVCTDILEKDIESTYPTAKVLTDEVASKMITDFFRIRKYPMPTPDSGVTK